jgi:nucleoside-diphosphate-sugar epimerase
MPKKILITGASGFIGSHLAKKCLKEGHSVNVFLRGNSDLWRIEDVIKDLNVYNLSLYEEGKIREAIKEIKPEIVFHFASAIASSFKTSMGDDISSNIIGTWNLLSSLYSQDYELFINAGSSSEYGLKTQPMKEEDLLEPNSVHSFSKVAQTLMCKTYLNIQKKPIVTLRLFSVYGPYERQNRLIPMVVKNCIEEKKINLSSPKVARDFIYVDDVVDLCLDFNRFFGLEGEIINIGTGVQSTIEQVVNMVFDITGKKVECIWDKDKRLWDTETWVADCSKAKRLLDWEYKINLREGLEKTINWMKNV